MCLLVLAWQSHAHYRLVVAANRDEFHARPATPLGPWPEPPGMIGGRDQQALGAWFAVDRQRRCGIVTNFREFGRRRRSAPSRGDLIPAYLAGGSPPGDYLRTLDVDACSYAGFNLLLSDRDTLWYASNRADRFARELQPGVYGLSNEFLDTPWPKLVRVREKFIALLEAPQSMDRRALAGALFTALADRRQAPPESLPASGLDPELARRLSAPFVLDQSYGTRCSTVLTISYDDELLITERRFDAYGEPAGESEYGLNAGS